MSGLARGCSSILLAIGVLCVASYSLAGNIFLSREFYEVTRQEREALSRDIAGLDPAKRDRKLLAVLEPFLRFARDGDRDRLSAAVYTAGRAAAIKKHGLVRAHRRAARLLAAAQLLGLRSRSLDVAERLESLIDQPYRGIGSRMGFPYTFARAALRIRAHALPPGQRAGFLVERYLQGSIEDKTAVVLLNAAEDLLLARGEAEEIVLSHRALVLPQTVQVAAARALAGLHAPSEEPWADDRMHQRQIETTTGALVVHSPCPPVGERFGLPDAAGSAIRAMADGEAWFVRLEATWQRRCADSLR